MASDAPTFQIPNDVIQPIIKAAVGAAIIQGLNGPNALTESLINGVLTAIVDEEGRPSTSGYRTRTYLTWLLEKAMREVVKETLAEEMAKHKEVLKKHLARELSNVKSPLVKQLVEGMTSGFTNPDNLKYRLEVTYAKAGR